MVQIQHFANEATDYEMEANKGAQVEGDETGEQAKRIN